MKKKTETKRVEKGEIAKMLLGAIGVAGIVVIAVAAPNALQVFTKLFGHRGVRYSKKSVDQSFRVLLQRGLARRIQGAHGWKIVLTDKGQRELLFYETKQKMLSRSKRWDHKWRLLIFDIQEKRRGTRDAIRRMLVTLGFYRLQDSVWVFPYECDMILDLLRTAYNIRHEAIIVRADRIANDRSLKESFGLSEK